ncbi:undecaprenyl-diphosphate phosphatase [Prochlorococcus marinus]|uniref:Undecaprenyl-diphosphatase n=1 Tax=Prochlorococcus marinus XMU1408 TaxID=2213228 RepID=A0A318R6F4_PROMR|nr:undecaprenyl-diphosphate phosphatase [Prochlorococcus marinus]MBW3041881.1 undecaprenyl-diphosphatase [Prochlorococcus marinus str. XMU1408]PYE03288.1 undecaprenyl-diphosphatase [Prochlorococcus marinus XMU1408]
MPELNHFIVDCFQSFLLGIIQGITEFLPISSSAHLKVVPYFLGWNDPGVSISASLQLGSAFAIVYYFRKDIGLIINSFIAIYNHRQPFKDENTKLATYIFVASIPIMILGLLIKIYWPGFSDSYFRGLFSIAIISIIMSLLLAISELCCDKKKLFNDIKLSDIFLLGISQSLAIFPGVSRSGITLTSALFSGIERKTAARISFLVGIPAISISGFVELFSIYRTSTAIDILPTIIGIISSFISSIISIDLLLRFLARNNTFIFIYYRLAFGTLILSIM